MGKQESEKTAACLWNCRPASDSKAFHRGAADERNGRTAEPFELRATSDKTTNGRTKTVEKVDVERVHNGADREVITVAQMGSERRASGSHRDGLTGQTYTDYTTVQVETRRITVTLEDGIVTSAEGR